MIMPIDKMCAICNSKVYSNYIELTGETGVVKCGYCGTLRTMPYPQLSYSENEKYCEDYIKNESRFRGMARDIVSIIQRHKKTGRVLDIGCAVGLVVEEARKAGFEAEGLELNEKAVEIALSKKLNVKKSDIKDAHYAKNTFDVIILNHVLEHIINLNEFISLVKNALKEDGIVAIGIPAHKALIPLLYKKAWGGWVLGEHIWHFDEKSLGGILSGHDMKIKEILRSSLYYPFSKSFRKNIMGIIARLGVLIGSGDQLTIVVSNQ